MFVDSSTILADRSAVFLALLLSVLLTSLLSAGFVFLSGRFRSIISRKFDGDGHVVTRRVLNIGNWLTTLALLVGLVFVFGSFAHSMNDKLKLLYADFVEESGVERFSGLSTQKFFNTVSDAHRGGYASVENVKAVVDGEAYYVDMVFERDDDGVFVSVVSSSKERAPLSAESIIKLGRS